MRFIVAVTVGIFVLGRGAGPTEKRRGAWYLAVLLHRRLATAGRAN